MQIMESLLGQFYHRIRGAQEDIASEGLAYILNRSIGASRALIKYVSSNTGITFSDLVYSTQAVGGNQERPDISGFDVRETEVLIIEAKFWASLTDNQPNTYLNRLGDSSVLLILCPNLRLSTLATEIKLRLDNPEEELSQSVEPVKYKLPGNKYILIATWSNVLNLIKFQLIQENDQTLISDIDQIIGLCNSIDRNSFQPIQSSDLSPSVAQKISSYHDLVDKVVDELKGENLADTKGLRATPQRDGYTKFFIAGELGAALEISFSLWSSKADTPFWLRVGLPTSKNWNWTRPELKEACRKVSIRLGYQNFDKPGSSFYFAIRPQLNQTEDKVVEDLKVQVKMILESVIELLKGEDSFE